MENQHVKDGPDGSILVQFDSKIYSSQALKKAAYKFARDCSVLVSSDGDKYIATIAFFDEKVDVSKKKRLIGAFCNEVIDQDLREQIFIQTEGMRNLILAQAFSKTSLLNND